MRRTSSIVTVASFFLSYRNQIGKIVYPDLTTDKEDFLFIIIASTLVLLSAIVSLNYQLKYIVENFPVKFKNQEKLHPIIYERSENRFSGIRNIATILLLKSFFVSYFSEFVAKLINTSPVATPFLTAGFTCACMRFFNGVPKIKQKKQEMESLEGSSDWKATMRLF